MAKAFAPKAVVEDEQQAHDNGLCGAFGCPMPGTHTNSTSGSDKWFCLMHLRAAPHNWSHVTERIRHHSNLTNLILDIRRHQNGKEIDYKGWAAVLKNAGLEDYLPNDIERARKAERMWLERLQKTQFDLVMFGMEEPESIPSGTTRGPDLMSKIDEFLKAHA